MTNIKMTPADVAAQAKAQIEREAESHIAGIRARLDEAKAAIDAASDVPEFSDIVTKSHAVHVGIVTLTSERSELRTVDLWFTDTLGCERRIRMDPSTMGSSLPPGIKGPFRYVLAIMPVDAK